MQRRTRQIKTFVSNSQDHRIRGTAKSIADKYLSLAEEAVEFNKEYFLQHADHWFRVAAQLKGA